MSAARSLKMYLSKADTELPPQWSVAEAVNVMLRLYEANGGSTFSLYFGNQAGQRLYAVSVYPERTVIIPGREVPPEGCETSLPRMRTFSATHAAA